MGHTYIANYQHIVFSTKERLPFIAAEFQPRLWGYLGGIADNHRCKALMIGGIEDHVHLLLSLPGDLDVSTAVNLLKSNSSRWVKGLTQDFAWQQGFAAFSVSYSNLEGVTHYIRTQAEHHARMNYETEITLMLEKHQIDYDPRWVLG